MKTIVNTKTYLDIVTFATRYLPAGLIRVLAFIRIQWKRFRMPEQKKNYGKLHPNRTFYVIRLYPPASGLLADYIYVLGMMEYASQKGWIPVVDMENYATMYDIDKPINGSNNVWEHYFQQPLIDGTRYTLEEVYQSKNVVLSNGTMDDWYFGADANDSVLMWQYKWSKRIGFQTQIREYLEKKYKETIPKDVRVIGVCLRGRAQKKRMWGNNIQMTVDDVIPILKEKLKEWNCTHIFVKSDEKEPIDEINKVFNNVLYTESSRAEGFKGTIRECYNDADLGINDNNTGEMPVVYTNQMQYLGDIYILSKCTCLISSNNNGCFGARIWNGGEYEHCHIIDKGVYE